jgi:spermidine synthase
LLSQLTHVVSCLVRRKPFVYRRDNTFSLHFDLMQMQSAMRCDAPEELVLPYTQTMMGFLLYQPKPRSIVMIGLGGGSLAKYCYHRVPKASLVVTEINPDVIALRDRFCIPKDDERFRVHCEDGAALVRRAQDPIDVLLVDGYDSKGQSPQLGTQCFYDDCHRTLSPEGILVVNFPTEEPSLNRSVARIRCSFRNVVVVESEDRTNKVAFASKVATLRLSHDDLCARLTLLEQNHPVGLRGTLHRIGYDQDTSPLASH